MPLFKTLVLIRGAGDLASGVAYRLVKTGFPVVMTDLAAPLLVRTTVSYGMCILYQAVIVEGLIARRATLETVQAELADGYIPVLVDPNGESIRALQPPIIVDARMAKINLGTHIDDAPLVICLGPGFTAGVDCHAVIETNRGHTLGRVFWRGSAEPNTGTPGAVAGKTNDRVLRAPIDGVITPVVMTGEYVKQGTVIARVGDVPLCAPFDGVLRGLMDYDMPVKAGLKIGDLDPRAERKHCFTISDKSLAVGGGVVEALLSSKIVNTILH